MRIHLVFACQELEILFFFSGIAAVKALHIVFEIHFLRLVVIFATDEPRVEVQLIHQHKLIVECLVLEADFLQLPRDRKDFHFQGCDGDRFGQLSGQGFQALLGLCRCRFHCGSTGCADSLHGVGGDGGLSLDGCRGAFHTAKQHPLRAFPLLNDNQSLGQELYFFGILLNFLLSHTFY